VAEHSNEPHSFRRTSLLSLVGRASVPATSVSGVQINDSLHFPQ
jgi:hypothetical protein